MGSALNYIVIRNLGFVGALLSANAVLFAEPSTYITAQSKNLPFPKAIELKVEFWKAIYTKYTVGQGIIHDSEDLSIIYDAVALPKVNEMGAVDRVRWQIRENIFNILRKRGANLTTEERAVLAKFPAGVSRARLMRATENIRFQRGQADRFKEGLIRSGLYLKHIEKILEEEGVPDFIKFLPHVESSYQEYAMSKLAAAGLWQLMPTTARMFDLRVEYAVDERLDPWVATRAAARHLKRDYKYLGSWALALTAYNHGPGGVMRAVKALGTDDIAEIAFNYQSPSFGFASRNFYCQFLAAVEVASNYHYYFGDLPIKKPLEFQPVKIERPTFLNDVAAKYSFNMDEFKKLNPGLRPPVLQNRRPISAGLTIRLPKASKREVLVAALDRSVGRTTAVKPQDVAQAEIRRAATPAPAAIAKLAPSPKTETASKFGVRDLADQRGWIEVAMNETISQVADWMGVTPDEIREWNGMDSGAQIQQDQRLLLKFEKMDPGEFVIAREDYHKQIREDFFARFEVTKTEDYLVKRGENLWSICYQKFDVPPWLLEEYNPKVDIAMMKPGTKLKIPQLIEKEFIAVGSTEAGLLQE